MEYYASLLRMGCFHRAEVAALTGNVRTADTILYAYKKKGWIASVRRDLYVAISPETGEPTCNPYQISSHITPDSYVSHHSAFEVHGMANQVFSDIYVSSSTPFRSFEFDGKRFVRVASATTEGVKLFGKIRATDIERTVIDSIKEVAKIGGLEELLRCLMMITYLDEDKLTKYLSIYDNCFLWQKTGYILSHFPNMKLSAAFYDTCKTHARKNIRYLYDELKYEDPIFEKQWGLFVPKDMMKLLDEGGQTIV